MGREVAIAFDYFLDGFQAESFSDERRFATWRDPHQRLGLVLAMLTTLGLWYAGGAWLPASIQRTYGLPLAFGASIIGNVVWFGVAALSRSR